MIRCSRKASDLQAFERLVAREGVDGSRNNQPVNHMAGDILNRLKPSHRPRDGSAARVKGRLCAATFERSANLGLHSPSKMRGSGTIFHPQLRVDSLQVLTDCGRRHS
jgi:hypothetical protein